MVHHRSDRARAGDSDKNVSTLLESGAAALNKTVTYDQFTNLVSSAKRENYKRAPNPKILDIMDPSEPIEVSSSSKQSEDVVRTIFLVTVSDVDEPMPVHLDVSKSDFDTMVG